MYWHPPLLTLGSPKFAFQFDLSAAHEGVGGVIRVVLSNVEGNVTEVVAESVIHVEYHRRSDLCLRVAEGNGCNTSQKSPNIFTPSNITTKRLRYSFCDEGTESSQKWPERFPRPNILHCGTSGGLLHQFPPQHTSLAKPTMSLPNSIINRLGSEVVEEIAL